MPASPLARRIHDRLRQALAPARVPLTPLVIDGTVAGRITPARAERLALFDALFRREGDALALNPDTPETRTAALAEVARTLAAEGALSAWRDERYAVAPSLGAPAWCEIERAAARYFGIRTYAAHVNGLVRTREGISMWLARRAPTKAIDPGMLDNLVGGGIAAGTSVAATMVKECAEEAGIPLELARTASRIGALHVERLHADGLQDEIVFVHDLWLPPDFVPANQDGEAFDHRCLDLGDVAPLLAQRSGPEALTIDASLVALDCLVRHGVLPAMGALSARPDLQG